MYRLVNEEGPIWGGDYSFVVSAYIRLPPREKKALKERIYNETFIRLNLYDNLLDVKFPSST